MGYLTGWSTGGVEARQSFGVSGALNEDTVDQGLADGPRAGRLGPWFSTTSGTSATSASSTGATGVDVRVGVSYIMTSNHCSMEVLSGTSSSNSNSILP